MFKKKTREERVYAQARRLRRNYDSFLHLLDDGVKLARVGGLQPGQAEAAFKLAGLPESLVESAVIKVYGEGDPLA